jgi:hypothetical protein
MDCTKSDSCQCEHCQEFDHAHRELGCECEDIEAYEVGKREEREYARLDSLGVKC